MIPRAHLIPFDEEPRPADTVLDTTALIHLYNEDLFLSRLLGTLPGSKRFTTVINRFEFLKVQGQQEVRRREDWLTRNVRKIIPLQERVLENAFQLFRDTYAEYPDGWADYLIGAIAKNSGKAVLTENDRHFGLFPGLTVYTYRLKRKGPP